MVFVDDNAFQQAGRHLGTGSARAGKVSELAAHTVGEFVERGQGQLPRIHTVDTIAHVTRCLCVPSSHPC